ncbi:integrase, catalytic region, zinc finger, CCHC-type containing protein [Tanacetum coccineum]|uniref:Integrase, catalytic region, zinc finger, CCHC-type containing protein n=1 Tax=Tanacetum coccineum TaxID=301880 RepID=A0ABQ4XY80_9ASTR
MSTQQYIYAAGSENRPPMLKKDNYVPWSSHLLRYAKSKPNGKLLVNSIKKGPYVRRMIYGTGDPNSVPPVAESTHEQTHDEITKMEVKHMEADDQDLHEVDFIQFYYFLKFNQVDVDAIRAERLVRTHDPLALMENSQNLYNNPVFHPDQPYSLTYMQKLQPNDNYIPQPSFNTNYMQQPMPNPEDISYPITAMNMALIQIVGGNGGNQFRQYAGHIAGNQNGYNAVQNVRNQIVQNTVQNLARAKVNGNENNGNGNNGNQIRCYNCRGLGHYARNCIEIDEIEEVNANCILMANLQQASTSGTQTDKAPVYDSDRSAKEKSTVSLLQEEKKRLTSDFKTCKDEFLNKKIQYEKKIKELDNILVKTGQSIQTMHMLSPKPDSLYHTKQKMALDDTLSVARKFLNEVKDTIVTLQNVIKHRMNADINKRSYPTYQEFHKIINEEISPIVNQVDAGVQNFKNHFVKEAAKFFRDFKSLAKKADKSLDKFSVLEKENEHLLRAVVSQDIMSIVLNPIVVESSNLQTELQHMKERVPPKVVEINDLSNPVTSNSVPTTNESHVMKNDKVTAPGMFRINPFKTSKKYIFVPINQARARGDITAKTRRPQIRSNTKNDRVPSASKSSCIKNNEVEVEDHYRKLLLSKNKKHMSSECLITDNHDVCVLNYVNAMNSRIDNQNPKVLNTANQKKHKAKVKNSKNLGSKERLASPKPIKPRLYHRWSSTGRISDCSGKIMHVLLTLKNLQENSFQFLLRFLAGCPNLFMVRLLGLLQAYDRESKASLFGSFWELLKRLLLRATLKTASSFTAVLAKLHMTLSTATEYLLSSSDTRTATATPAPQVLQTPTMSTTTVVTSLTTTNLSSQTADTPSTLQDVDELQQQLIQFQQQDDQSQLQPAVILNNGPNAMFDRNMFVNPFASSSISFVESSSQYLRTDGEMCIYALTVSTMEPKTLKEVMIDPAWIDSMQEEL